MTWGRLGYRAEILQYTNNKRTYHCYLCLIREIFSINYPLEKFSSWNDIEGQRAVTADTYFLTWSKQWNQPIYSPFSFFRIFLSCLKILQSHSLVFSWVNKRRKLNSLSSIEGSRVAISHQLWRLESDLSPFYQLDQLLWKISQLNAAVCLLLTPDGESTVFRIQPIGTDEGHIRASLGIIDWGYLLLSLLYHHQLNDMPCLGSLNNQPPPALQERSSTEM